MSKQDTNGGDSIEKLKEKVSRLEADLADSAKKAQESGIELEASEALLKMALDDMRRIYDDLLNSQGRLMQADKMSTIGLLTAGIVHELNNPLSAVKLAFSVIGSQFTALRASIEKRGALGDEEKKLLTDLDEFVRQGTKCSDHLARIVTDIRTFSKTDKGVVNPESINVVIDSTISVIWSAVKNKVKIVKKYGDLPAVKCNKQQISQVILNLLVNASQAMKSDGVITITTTLEGKNVSVKIADTGHGMPKEVMGRLFEPFFTTKGDEGTGLGLGITRDIIKKHDGDISVASEPGKGTTFTILLPVA